MKIAPIAVGLSVCLASFAAADTVTQFRTTLDESFVILGGVQGTGSDAGGYAEYTLTQVDGDPTQNTMEYFIQFENVDLDGMQTPNPLDDITALHIHDTTRCSSLFPQCIEGTDTAGTMHLLNIFGAPRNDDDDIVVDPVAGTISGLWDDGDATPGLMFPTLPISDPMVLGILLSEQAALFVHTNETPAAASGGYLLIVPEPSAMVLILSILGLVGFCRR
jgi:hypothetical protein